MRRVSITDCVEATDIRVPLDSNRVTTRSSSPLDSSVICAGGVFSKVLMVMDRVCRLLPWVGGPVTPLIDLDSSGEELPDERDHVCNVLSRRPLRRRIEMELSRSVLVLLAYLGDSTSMLYGDSVNPL